MQMKHPVNEPSQTATVFDAPFGAYERHVLRHYVLCALRPEKGKSKVHLAEEFLDWYRDNQRELNLDIPAVDGLIADRNPDRHSFGDVSLRIPVRQIDSQTRTPPAKSSLQRRLDWIASTLHLPSPEASILGAMVRLTRFDPFLGFREALNNDRRDDEEIQVSTLSRICGLGRSDARNLFAPSGLLLQLGLLEDRRAGDFALSTTISAILEQDTDDPEDMASTLFGPSVAPNLAASDFEHLGETQSNILKILGGALKAKETGASVLFYGAPGTGKTEFARVVGAALDARIVFVGELNGQAKEPSRADRIAHLALLSSLALHAGSVILVIDEADDIFTGIDDEDSSNRAGSKVFMNRIVENCSVPTIWITNFPERLGQSVIRRMLHAVAFRQPNLSARRRIVSRHAEMQGISLSVAELDAAATLASPPAVVEAGFRATRLAGGGARLALEASKSILKAMGQGTQLSASVSKPKFDIALTNTNADLSRIVERVGQLGPGPLSFLFSGAPGTGKSAFAQHLAKTLGLEILQKRGSDLFGMYVGETEKQIALAFEEAADQRCFLIFDEVDSLLPDRRNVHHRWEISAVNEMLSWMERHPHPFAATTNFAEHLDPATQRRFVFKVHFQPMTSEQVVKAFRQTFAVEPPASVAHLDHLTPGDFAVVSRRAQLLGETEPFQLAQMLAEEINAKTSREPRPVGFRALVQS